ncbi:MAG: hypothetical protein IJI43_03850 [Bacilli bacterium]|nr:hypothetical protein [Bacilli bacterium]
MENILETGKHITLDNNIDYVIVSNTTYEDDNYILLINPSNPEEYYISRVTMTSNGIKLYHVDLEDKDNEEIIKELSKLFQNDIQEYLINKLKDD